MQLSDQQQAIVSAVADNDKDVEVDARAGTGKTTTLLAAVAEAGGDVLIVAFNKAIAGEMKTRAPSGVKVQTLHSFGFGVLRNYYENVTLEEDKTYDLLVEIFNGSKPQKEVVYPVTKLVGLAKNTLCETDDQTLQELADDYEIPLDEGTTPTMVCELVRKVLAKGVPSSADTDIKIDYDDMIYLPCILPWVAIPTYDWVFCDEAQDMNAPQHKLVLSAAEGGRICYAGDPHQAIYGFRGSDSRSMKTMRSTLESQGRTVVQLPLTRTRRCPKAVVKRAQEYVPDFEALPEAPDGIVRFADRMTFEREANHGDMVVCRLNAPAVRAAYSLIKQGKRARIQGRDLGAAIVRLIESFRARTIEELEERLDSYSLREMAKLQKRYASKPSKLKNSMASLQDKIDVIRILIDQYTSVPELVMSCQNIFTDTGQTGNTILCSTVHRAKGLEAERVWVLETGFRGSGGQEDNIAYVAATRAKKELVYVRWEESL